MPIAIKVNPALIAGFIKCLLRSINPLSPLVA